MKILNRLRQARRSKDRAWRRFELRFAESSPENKELNRLLDRLKLNRRELALIVLGLRVRPGFELEDFDT